MAVRLEGMRVEGPCPRSDAKYSGAAQNENPRAARAPLPELRPFLWLHSFSSLTRHAVAVGVEAAAADEAQASEPDASDAAPVADPRLLALDIWRGRHFGDAVHKLLEDAVPINRDALVARLAALAVRPRGGDGDAFTPVAQMLHRVRTSDLGNGLRLCDLPAEARVAEFEFQFPVAVNVARLRAICTTHAYAELIPASLHTPALRGMLTGFADLIFEFGGRYHVLDYKTNRLGLRLTDYSGAALDAAMDAHHYALQALLYTVALHRYLRTRLRGYAPARHLGESWYLFLRAVGLQPEAGVWRRQWPVTLIEELDEVFSSETVA